MTTETTGLSIAALELETGIAKDTLRVWERRYGFPQPQRDEFGERIYPLEQVDDSILYTIRNSSAERARDLLILTGGGTLEHVMLKLRVRALPASGRGHRHAFRVD